MFESLDRLLKEEYMKEGGQLPPYQPKGMEIKVLDNPELYPYLYKEKLNNMDKLDDRELFNIIAPTLSLILTNIVEGVNDGEDLKYFSNERFLDTLIRVVSNVPLKDLDYYNLNAILYQYFESQIQNGLEEKMINLGLVVNRNFVEDIIRLVDIPNKEALKIALAATSSNDILANMINMNNLIANIKDLDEQKVIFIYESFIDRGFIPGDFRDLGIIRLRELFKSVMLYLNDVTNDKVDGFTKIINAVLIMLENSSFEAIRIVLIEFYNTIAYNRCNYRFSLANLDQNQYPRIIQVIYVLATNGIIIP